LLLVSRATARPSRRRSRSSRPMSLFRVLSNSGGTARTAIVYLRWPTRLPLVVWASIFWALTVWVFNVHGDVCRWGCSVAYHRLCSLWSVGWGWSSSRHLRITRRIEFNCVSLLWTVSAGCICMSPSKPLAHPLSRKPWSSSCCGKYTNKQEKELFPN